MFICDKNFNCCAYQYWDRKEDIDKDALECGHCVEVAEIRHGKWITCNSENPTEIYGICSVCGFEQSVSNKFNYCPNCGAVMDLESKERIEVNLKISKISKYQPHFEFEDIIED